MVSRRKTLAEVRWPQAPEFGSVAKGWNSRAITLMLTWVWNGYDALLRDVADNLDWSQAEDDLERSITELLEVRIRESMSGYAPFYVQHGAFERECREPAPAQTPQYDIAFVLRECPRVMWPLEAKVLKTGADLADYLQTLNERFLTCVYAPFSSEAAMISYLINGEPQTTLVNIGKRLTAEESPRHHPDFQDRPHEISKHLRSVPTGRSYPAQFACHHMIMQMRRSG